MWAEWILDLKVSQSEEVEIIVMAINSTGRSIVPPRLMTMSPLYPWGKPCSTGTHTETVKKLALFSAFDRSNENRTTALILFNGYSSERISDKNHIKQTFNQRNLV